MSLTLILIAIGLVLTGSFTGFVFGFAFGQRSILQTTDEKTQLNEFELDSLRFVR